MSTKVVLVTGASSGIGASAAIALAQAGFIVYGAARRLDQLERLRSEGVRPVFIDVTDEASIDVCLARVRAESGDIDILVNNAGYGAYGALEEVPLAEARGQFDVNLFGLANLTAKLIPAMRNKGWGRIINISSIGGVLSLPFGGWYHASKFALEGYSAALRQELYPFGIAVAIIRPGVTRSEWSDVAASSLQRVSGAGPYARGAAAIEASLLKDAETSRFTDGPETIAKLIVVAATSDKPKTVYVPHGHARALLLVRSLLCDRLYDTLMRWWLRLPPGSVR